MKIIAIITLVFCVLIAFNASPILLGPDDRLLYSKQTYYFINTVNKIWVPLLFGVAIIALNYFVPSEKKFLVAVTTLTFGLQISLVYFSRFGLGVLMRRLVSPGINGYFDASIRPYSILEFWQKFPFIKNTLVQHARSHPPGMVIILKIIEWITNTLPIIHLPVARDSAFLWNPLSPQQKLAVLISIGVLYALSALTVVAVYYLGQCFKVGKTTAILYALVPAASYFALIGDPFYAFFPAISLALILKKHYLWAGILSGLSLLFSVVPLLIIALISLFMLLQRSWKKIPIYFFGIAAIFAFLAIFKINLVAIIITNIGDQAHRQYLSWLFGDPYMFAVYLGLPIAILVIYNFKDLLKTKIWSVPNKLFLSFCVTFVLLVWSGVSRGEVEHTWLPLMFIPTVLAAQFIKLKNFSRLQITTIFLLLIIQTIVIEEFWVPIW